MLANWQWYEACPDFFIPSLSIETTCHVMQLHDNAWPTKVTYAGDEKEHRGRK
jgi:hypothetical protein